MVSWTSMSTIVGVGMALPATQQDGSFYDFGAAMIKCFQLASAARDWVSLSDQVMPRHIHWCRRVVVISQDRGCPNILRVICIIALNMNIGRILIESACWWITQILENGDGYISCSSSLLMNYDFNGFVGSQVWAINHASCTTCVCDFCPLILQVVNICLCGRFSLGSCLQSEEFGSVLTTEMGELPSKATKV